MQITIQEIQNYISQDSFGFAKFANEIEKLELTKTSKKYVLKIIAWWGAIYTFKNDGEINLQISVLNSIKEFLIAVNGKEGKEAGRTFKRNFLTVPNSKKLNPNSFYVVNGVEYQSLDWGRPRQVNLEICVWKAYKNKVLKGKKK